jgi:hypothetical protein
LRKQNNTATTRFSVRQVEQLSQREIFLRQWIAVVARTTNGIESLYYVERFEELAVQALLAGVFNE